LLRYAYSVPWIGSINQLSVQAMGDLAGFEDYTPDALLRGSILRREIFGCYVARH